MSIPGITALPAVPSRSDPSNFNTVAETFFGAFPNLRTEINAFATAANNWTGSVVQFSGSNANGDWWSFTNGLTITYRSVASQTVSSTTTNLGWNNTAILPFTAPAAFGNTPMASLGWTSSSIGGGVIASVSFYSGAWQVRFRAPSSFTSVATGTFSLIAIGPSTA